MPYCSNCVRVLFFVGSFSDDTFFVDSFTVDSFYVVLFYVVLFYVGSFFSVETLIEKRYLTLLITG